MAQDLLTMIADAEATDDAQEFIDLYGTAADATDDGRSLRFKLGSTHIVHFEPVGKIFESGDNGNVNWPTVTRMKLTAIVEVR